MGQATAPARLRLRIIFRKEEPIKYISHLDLLRAWERIIRRAGLPLAYSQGFSPHPRITIAMPLPVGCTGTREVIDIVVIEPYSAQEAIDALKPALPCSAGQACISVVSVQEIPLNSPALATLFRQATYHITLSGIPEIEVERQVADFLRQDEVPVEFRRKRFDLRPLVSSLRVGGTPAHARGVTPMCAGETLETEQIRSTTCLLEANLVRDSKGRIGRPDVLLQALGLNEHARRIHRQEMVFDETK
jgi:radical SAM-linked protein